jgi:hypothetical protein
MGSDWLLVVMILKHFFVTRSKAAIDWLSLNQRWVADPFKSTWTLMPKYLEVPDGLLIPSIF